MLRNRSFTVGTICAALSFFAFSSIMVIMPLYIQNDRGYSATISGLVMMPGAFGMCISQFFGGKLLDRLGARPVALSGTLVLLFGTIMMSLIDSNTWIWWVSIWQFVRQIGMGFIIMPITTWSLNCLDPTEVSAGSAVTNTVRQIAGAIGAPVLVILMETLIQLHGATQSPRASSARSGRCESARSSCSYRCSSCCSASKEPVPDPRGTWRSGPSRESARSRTGNRSKLATIVTGR